MDFALDAGGRVAHASTAPPAGSYRCPRCHGPVDLVRGVPPPCFQHGPGGTCDGSRVEREVGRLLLAQQVRGDLLERDAVRWRQRCPGPEGDGACPHGTLLEASHAIPVWSTVRAALDDAPALRDATALGDTSGLDAGVDGGPGHGAAGFDVAVMRREQVLFGFVLLPSIGTAAPDGAAPDGAATATPALRFALDDVLAFRPLVPHDGGLAADLCPACRARGAGLGTAPRDEVSEFLDGAFVAEAGRVQRAWDAVLAAAVAGARRGRRAKPAWRRSGRAGRQGRAW